VATPARAPVGVQGRLEWREWESQEGGKRQAVDIIGGAGLVIGGCPKERRRAYGCLRDELVDGGRDADEDRERDDEHQCVER
jgi:single-stranded DNA-binding protein